MSRFPEPRRGVSYLSPLNSHCEKRYCAWFHELDAWTEYWDIYHPETQGRYYFGNGGSEKGLLTRFVPSPNGNPQVFRSWISMALGFSGADDLFARSLHDADTRSAILEIDDLLGRLFEKYFGNPSDPWIQEDYLQAMLLLATDDLPPATERKQRIPDSDPRKATAGRHAIEGDIMWFTWALQIEAAQRIVRTDSKDLRRSLMLAGAVVGCSANFAWRGHRRTRTEYHCDTATIALLLDRGLRWVLNFELCVKEVHALYQIREWGHEE